MCERFVYMISVGEDHVDDEFGPTPLYRRIAAAGDYEDGNHNFDWGIWSSETLAEAERDKMKQAYPDTEYVIKKIPVMGTRNGGVG